MNIKKLSAIILIAFTLILKIGISHAASKEPIVVRIASHVSALSPLHQQSQMFVDEIEKRLPGQFKFKIYPGGQLGKEKALITNVKAGSLEMINVASGIMKLDKKLGLFDLPWLFADRKHVQRAMEGELGIKVRERIEKKAGVKVIGMYENGFRHVLNKVRLIKKPADLKGMKVRISGGKFRQGVFQQMGATPQKISWKETFTALQTGVVDGVEAATYGFYGQKQYEVAKYLSLTGHVYTPSFMVASKKFWNSLSTKQQKIFTEVGNSMTDKAYLGAKNLEAKYFKEMKKYVEINEVDLSAFQNATKSSYEKYVKSQGDDWLKLVKAAQ